MNEPSEITMRFMEQNGQQVLLVIGRASLEVIGEDGQLLPFIRSTRRTEMSQKLSGSERQ
jgi:hypothetical protein